ncbi:MAG TPA: AraC family transcriptional regulator [Rhodocyclaceae bacterium]|nr:AraC family transcriptional regulator [Rhodocyclaceae bacterium]
MEALVSEALKEDLPDALLNTFGTVFHAGKRVRFAVHERAEWIPTNKEEPRYVLCHVRAGSAVFVMDGVAIPVMAPATILLDETLRPEILHARDLRIVSLYFHPSLINNAFSLEQIQSQGGRDALKGSIHQDLFLLERFFASSVGDRVAQLPPHVNERVSQSIDLGAVEMRIQPDKYWPCRIRSFLIEALFQLRMLEPMPSSSVFVPADDMRASRVARAMSFLQERYHSDFTLSEVARVCCTNRTTLNSEFRAATGMTVRAYTISLRIKMAAGLLRDTGLPVAEIMSRVGYENPSHFTRAFRQTIGASPRDYRTAQCWVTKP